MFDEAIHTQFVYKQVPQKKDPSKTSKVQVFKANGDPETKELRYASNTLHTYAQQLLFILNYYPGLKTHKDQLVWTRPKKEIMDLEQFYLKEAQGKTKESVSKGKGPTVKPFETVHKLLTTYKSTPTPSTNKIQYDFKSPESQIHMPNRIWID